MSEQNKIEPGIYPDMSNADYHASSGISKSGITLLLESPLKYKSRYIDLVAGETTPAMIIGSATHTAVFEPEKFNQEYAIAPVCDKRTKEGKAIFANFLETAGDKTPLSESDASQISAIRDAVLAHPVAGKMVTTPKKLIENSIFTVHEATGLVVKIRPDCLVDGFSIIDLKTTTNASAGAFSNACANFSYHIQAGMYLSIAKQHGLDVNDFYFIAVEKTPPYSVAVYRANKKMVELGLQEFERGMAIYAACIFNDQWPGYNDDGIVSLGLPSWVDRAISLKG